MSERNQNVDQIKFLLNQLSKRVPWVISKSKLKKIGIHTSNGWDATIEEQDVYNSTADKQLDVINKLKDFYTAHLFAGEKLVYWFSLKGIPDEILVEFDNKIRLAKHTIQIPKTDYSDVFPFSILEKAKLEALESSGSVLTNITDNEDKIYFSFSSVISFREKIEISPEKFSEAERATLSQYESVFAILPIRKHCYDVIVYDKTTKMIEVRIDAPIGISFDELSIATTNLYNAFNLLASSTFGYGPLGDASINLYSAINKIYKNQSEGIVFELGFMAETATSSSNNQGKLFRSRRNRDLRKDDFHKGGSSAVTGIIPYRIGVEWSGQNFDGTPNLILPGNMRMLLKAPNVSMAYIRGCLSKADYDFVASRLLTYVMSNSKT